MTTRRITEIPTSGSYTRRPGDGQDLSVLEQARVRSKGGIGPFTLGHGPEGIPPAVAVARRGYLLDTGAAEVGDSLCDQGVGDIGSVGGEEGGRVESWIVQIARGWGAVEEIRGYG